LTHLVDRGPFPPDIFLVKVRGGGGGEVLKQALLVPLHGGFGS